MSLLKKYANPANKSKRNNDESVPEPPSVPTPLFRKSTSIDSQNGTDAVADRHEVQQPGRSGSKKKIFPSFFSNLFGNNSKIPEDVSDHHHQNHGKKISSSRSAGGELISGKKSFSRESLNSVLSSSSFSYVNPKSIGGKRVKGKRIPVDDPNYGSTSAASNKNSEGRKGFGNTIEKIGVRIGLKKKYNLQSCESLQYIDACDEPLPTPCSSSAINKTSPPSSSAAAGVAGSSSAAERVNAIPVNIEIAQGHPRRRLEDTSGLGQIDPALKFAVVKSSKINVKGLMRRGTEETTPEKPVEEQPKLQNEDVPKQSTPVEPPKNESKEWNGENRRHSVKVESSVQTVLQTSIAPLPSQSQSEPSKPSVDERTTSESKRSPVKVESSVQTTIKSNILSSPFSSSSAKVITPSEPPPAPANDGKSNLIPKEKATEPVAQVPSNVLVLPVDTSKSPSDTTSKPSSMAEPKAESIAVKAAALENKKSFSDRVNPTNEITEPKSDIKTSEVTSPSISHPTPSRDSSVPPPAIPSTSRAAILPSGSSNTWSNSGRKKRKAPPPPPSNASTKFSNGISPSTHNTSIVTELSNDVPSTSSRAAMLTKFKRIEESPPPPTKPSSGTFEIRPRKKERSLEPVPVARPISSYATPSSNSTSNTLFSTRYQNHKRSNSEGLQNSGSNTKGRVHKPGKKKAPAPPNPFGDPDAPEEEDTSNNDAAAPIASQVKNATSTTTSSTGDADHHPAQAKPSGNLRTSPPSPKATPKVAKPTAPAAPNPFEDETPSSSVDTTINNGESSSTTLASAVITTPSSRVPEAVEVPSSRPTLAVAPPETLPPPVPNNVAASSVTHEELAPDVDEEIRQNMINDQQERQQLGLLNAQPDNQSSPNENAAAVPEPERVEPIVASSSSSSASASSPQAASTSGAITERDVQAAQHNLEVLMAASAKNKTPQAKAADPSVKAKLSELKKEAEMSPLNAPRTKSRPMSIGSAIYESLLGKSTSSGASANSDGSAGSSPKVTPKPWYKNLGPYKSRQPTQIKPFTSLVKFSELDKEAAKIVEENKRKSAAEERFLENTQDELDELFAGISDDESSAPQRNEQGVTIQATTVVSSAAQVPQPVQVLTTAQVHPISEGRLRSTDSNSTPQASTSSTSSVQETGKVAPSSSSSKDGSSSPPTFQSVHAASKHRQIKPLLSSSPITNLRSEKLAIVQPQTSSKKTDNTSTGESSATQVLGSRSISASSSSTDATSQSATRSNQITPRSLLTNVNSNSTSGTSNAPVSSPTLSPPAQSDLNATTTTSAISATITNTVATTNSTMWDCPRCTLKNPNWRSLCEACYFRKDPPGLPSSFMSSILQRVNSESNKPLTNANQSQNSTPATSSPSTPEETVNASTTPPVTAPSTASILPSASSSPSVTSVNSGNSSQSIPSPYSEPSTSTRLSSTSKGSEENCKKIVKNDIPSPPPPCENFLSQLPSKDDLSKEKKLHGIKLHEDPEVEELDIGKLREARLAYFRRRRSSENIESSPEPNNPPSSEGVGNTHKTTNDLGAALHQQQSSKLRSDKSDSSNASSKKGMPERSNTFEDNEDDFIDDLLQIDAGNNVQSEDNIPTTIANITNSLSRPSTTPTSTDSFTPENESATLSANAPQLSHLANRYRPALEAIREGNSQDYMYCYSPGEIAQIYENWQTSQTANKSDNNAGSNKSLQVSSPHPPHQTILQSGVMSPHFASQYAPHSLQTHLFGSQGAAPAPLMLNQLQEPLLFNASSSLQRASPNPNPVMRGTLHSAPIIPSVLMMSPVLDHQPYANNRLADSPEENYANTSALLEQPNICAPARNTPTLNESANFSRTVSPIPPPLRLSPFPLVSHRPNVQVSVPSENTNPGCILLRTQNQLGPPQIPYLFGGDVNSSATNNINSYENRMSFTPGEREPKLSYEDYKNMGAIPKGYHASARQNEEWSSESSGDTDSSRGFWGRGGGYQDSLPGMSRRSTIDFSQDMPFPDHTVAVGKLMKRLEAAIANGDHRLAATLAHDLALMKVNCVVAKINQPFPIRVYVEDRFMQQGPFLVQVSSMMTIRELKTKIENDWGIPCGFQKWILGQKMAEDDNQSLTTFELARDSMAFLFLVTPEMDKASKSGTLPTESSKGSKKEASIKRDYSEQSASTSRKSAQKSYSERANSFEVATGSSGTSIDPTTLHAYECLDDFPTYNNLENYGPQKSQRLPEKNLKIQTKTSSAAQTELLSKPEKEDNTESNIPPPLPSRSSSQAQSKIKSQNTTPAPTSSKQILSAKSSPKVGRQEIKNPSQTHIPEALSAASALTLSLQQKLAEFKVVAEQTFGKAGIPLPPSSSSKLTTKEQSPGPTSSKVSNIKVSSDMVNVRRNSEGKDAKPATKKIGKSQLTPTSSKEKLMSSPSSQSESTEKLHPNSLTQSKRASQERPITPENRFNGILLPTSDDENIKPPERHDKTKKLQKENENQETATSPVSDRYETVASPTKQEADNKTPSTLYSTSAGSKKPPVPPQSNVRDAKSPIRADNSDLEQTKILAQTQSEIGEQSAPQPTPRGIKRQVTSPERVSTPPILEAPGRPAPTPRTASKVDTSTTVEPRRSVTPKQQSGVQTEATSFNNSGPSYPQQNPSISEYCQTTLPFPVAKSRNSGGYLESSTANILNDGESSASQMVVSSSNNEPISKTLLRPSAFVTQMRVDNNSQHQNSTNTAGNGNSVFLSAMTANLSTTIANPMQGPYFSSTTTTTTNYASKFTHSFNSPSIAVAHVQPLSNFGKQTSPPTAYVSPSLSTATSAPPNPSAAVPSSKKDEPSNKKQDDSAVQSYLKMLEMMEKQDLICTTEDAECPVCFVPLPKGEGIILRDCLHVFCRECLVGCVQYADDSTVKCPYRDNNYACNNNLQEREIKALVPTEVFEKYLARSVKLAESKIVNTFHCKTPDCTGWCVFEDDVNVFLCPVCKKRNCLTCAAIHEGMDCQKYQRELAIAAETDEDAKQSRLMLEKMIQRGEALECPACHVVLLKKWGCDWVRCSYCKTEICWVTKGFRWGKGGKGDISGGCRCGVNGVKCHPKCTYCH